MRGLPLEDVWLQAAGWRNYRVFEEASIRAAYHDLLEPEPGFTSDAQIEVMSVALRHDHHQLQTRIERFGPINILSLAPMDSLSQLPSWEVNGEMQTIRYTWVRPVQQRAGQSGHRRRGWNTIIATRATTWLSPSKLSSNWQRPLARIRESCYKSANHGFPEAHHER